MFDCHVHCSFSGDSEMPPEHACHTAVGIGLDGIAFTDHLDYDFPNFDINFMIDFDVYSEHMDRLKEKYSDRLIVLKGIEVGLQPHVLKDTDELVKKYDFDLVIGSVHVIGKADPYIGEFYEGKSKYEAYLKYLEEILKLLNEYDNYDVLGHIDYIARYGCYDDRSLLYKDYTETIDEILKLVITKGKGMEINTSTYRDKPDKVTPCYDVNILKRYKELGGEIITLGSDAHSTDYIGYKLRYFREVLKNAGFKYTAHFEGREARFERI